MGIPSVTLRLGIYRLADQLIREGNIPMAKRVLAHLEQVMPDKVIPYDQFSASMVGLYLEAGDEKKALAMANVMVRRNAKAMDYYLSGGIRSNERNIQIALYEMNLIISSLKESSVAPAKYKELETMFTAQMNKVQ
jgi:hypothetical protein